MDMVVVVGAAIQISAGEEERSSTPVGLAIIWT